jgi:hypothetical protein
VIDADKSCRNVVSRIISWLADVGETVPSPNTGGYSQARQRLPAVVFKRLFHYTGEKMEAQVLPETLWCGRTVKLMDGSNVSMPDTAANQAAYPQHSNQAEGCGFPIAKLMVMFSLTTGAAIGVLIESFKTSELVLARNMYSLLKAMDVVLADRAFGNYVDLVWVKALEADAVFRCHQGRKSDFQQGKRLGEDDHIVQWFKPKQCPKHMEPQAFAQLPASVEVRQVRFRIEQPGFRTQTVIVVTTLLDANAFPKVEIAKLYRLRWSVEILQPQYPDKYRATSSA